MSEEPNFCESCAMDLATCDCVNPRPVRVNYAPSRANPTPVEAGGEAGWLYFNEDTGTEWSEQHPIESGECPDATDVRPGNSANLLIEMRSAWTMLSEREQEIERLRALAKPAPAVEAVREALRAIYEWYDRDGSVGGASAVFEEHRAAIAPAAQAGTVAQEGER